MSELTQTDALLDIAYTIDEPCIHGLLSAALDLNGVLRVHYRGDPEYLPLILDALNNHLSSNQPIGLKASD